MIEYTLNEEGNLTSVIEFWLVNRQGKIDDNGKYVFVKDWIINPSCRNKNSVAIFAEKLINRVPQATHCYFERRKYNCRLSPLYPKRKWVKVIQKFYKKEANYGKQTTDYNSPTTAPANT